MLLSKTLFKRKATSKDSLKMKTYLHQRGKLKIRNGVLYRYTEDWSRPDRSSMQLCLSKSFRKEALEGCHDNVGHLGLVRTLDPLRDRFYWPHLLDDAKGHVETYRRCQVAKSKQQKVPMQPYYADTPMELVYMDYLTV